MIRAYELWCYLLMRTSNLTEQLTRNQASTSTKVFLSLGNGVWRNHTHQELYHDQFQWFGQSSSPRIHKLPRKLFKILCFGDPGQMFSKVLLTLTFWGRCEYCWWWDTAYRISSTTHPQVCLILHHSDAWRSQWQICQWTWTDQSAIALEMTLRLTHIAHWRFRDPWS